MKINEELTTPFNYQFIIADENEIAYAVWKKDDSALWTLRDVLESLRQGGEAVKIWMQIIKSGMPSFAKVQTYHNIVPSVLRNAYAAQASGDTVTPTFKCNYFSLGTGSSTPSNSDVALQTETLRALFTDRSSYLNVAYLDVFFPTASVAGNTYNEAGIFVDGSAGADTGYLLSRVAINQTLGAAQTLTVNCSITYS